MADRRKVRLTFLACVVVGVCTCVAVYIAVFAQDDRRVLKVEGPYPREFVIPGVDMTRLDPRLDRAWGEYQKGEYDSATATCDSVLADAAAAGTDRALAAALKGWTAFTVCDYEASVEAGEVGRQALEGQQGGAVGSVAGTLASLLGHACQATEQYELGFDASIWGLQTGAESEAAAFLPKMVALHAQKAGMADRVPLVLEPFLAAHPDVPCAHVVRRYLGRHYRHEGAPSAALGLFEQHLMALAPKLPPGLAEAVNQLRERAQEDQPTVPVTGCLTGWTQGNPWVTRRVCLPDVRDKIAPITDGKIEVPVAGVGKLLEQKNVISYTLGETKIQDGTTAEVPAAIHSATPEGDGADTLRLEFALKREDGIWWISDIKPGE